MTMKPWYEAPWVHAAVLATISGLSLPFGAILGIILSPVRDVVCAAWVAFGAGALLFAVTVELYGHALRELDAERAGLSEMFATVAGAFVGALFYLAVNRWLEERMEPEEEPDSPRGDDLEQIDENESDVGSLAQTEHAPLLPKGCERLHSPIGTALAQERKMWEAFRKQQEGREDSFARNTSFSRTMNASFSRFANTSFALSEGSFKSRGRDSVLNRMSVISGSHASKRGGPVSVAESIADVDPDMAQKGNNVAFALFLGLLVDGVPEGILMGFLAAEGHLSSVLVVSLLVANFPEAFSSASLMIQGGIAIPIIVSMWTGLCLMVGVLAGISAYLLQLYFPSYPAGNLPHALLLFVAGVQGITGGAMISCIATVMLPEAFSRGGGRADTLLLSSGFLCTAGFLTAVSMKALEHHYHDHHH